MQSYSPLAIFCNTADPFLQRDAQHSMVFAVATCQSVTCIVFKQPNISLKFFDHLIASPF